MSCTELTPGLWHWSVTNPKIGSEVSSYYLAAERVVLDPMLPPEADAFFAERGTPEHVLLSNRHHDRDAWRLRETYGCEVHCVRNGVHELEGRGPVTPFEFGEALPGGVVAHEIGAICPDEAALHIPSHRALSCADGIVDFGDGLTFVPDFLMDEPDATKRALRDAYRRLLDDGLAFDLLLLAHGAPVTVEAQRALRAFVDD